MQYPKRFSHIGISVVEIEKFVEWYQDVLGWYVIMKPTLVENESESAIGIMCQNVFGQNFKNFKISHMSTSDGIGFEVFEFPETDDKPITFNPYQKGLFHFCVQDPDIEGLVEKIKANGGKQTMPIREYYPQEKPYKMVYVQDPWGNTFEIYTNSYELTYSSGAYQD